MVGVDEAESASSWARVDSCSASRNWYLRKTRSRLCWGRPSTADGPETAGAAGNSSADMMWMAFGVDLVGLWHCCFRLVFCWCEGSGGEARMLIVKDLWWAFEVVIGKLLLRGDREVLVGMAKLVSGNRDRPGAREQSCKLKTGL